MNKTIKALSALVVAAGLTVGGAAVAANANYIGIDCATASLEPHRSLQNGDHINIDITKGGVKSQVNAYVDRNIEGGWDTLGLRLTTPGGEVKVPLTQEQIESGKLVFNFGQYITGSYTVEWAQFNNSYFNSERATGKFLQCGTPSTPTITEIPYPTLLGNEVCGVKNDTFYVDPAWVEKYGHLVNGPWIDPNYKLQNGLWVVDGSAQIKPDFRKTYIWAGTGSTAASDFRRWQMYPGTQPFVYEDKGASDQTADPAAPCFTRPDTPVKENLVVTKWEKPDCISKTVEGEISTTVYTYLWNEETKVFDETATTTVADTSRPLTEDEAAACAPAHSGTITGDCDEVVVTLTNEEGEGRLTASFVLYVDGEFYDAYAVLAGETQTVTIEGDGEAHTYELRTGASQGDKFVAELEVDKCEVPPTEPPVVNPPVVNPPAAPELPAKLAVSGVTLLGMDVTPIAYTAAGLVALGIAVAVGAAIRRRRSA